MNIMDDCVAFRSFAFFLDAAIPTQPTTVMITPITLIDNRLSMPLNWKISQDRYRVSAVVPSPKIVANTQAAVMRE